MDTLSFMPKRVISSLTAATSVALGMFSIHLTETPVDATSPFECQPGLYQVISGQLNILNPVSGQYSPIGSTQPTYNAIGFNPIDNYLYGWGTGGNINGQVIRIASDGSITTMGNAGQTGTTFVSADFDAEGFLWMRKNATTLVKVDVSGATATSENVTFTGSSISGVDMGWIGGVMYSALDTTLVRTNLTDKTVTHATITDLNSPAGKEFPSTGSFGAVFANRSDELYISRNENGAIYRITDYAAANPRATWVVDATQTNNNDGAACKLAPSVFDVPTSSPDSYTTPNDTPLEVGPSDGVLANDDAGEPTVVSNTEPNSGSLVMNDNGSFIYTPAQDFTGRVTFDYTGQDQWGRSMQPATVTIEVTTPVSQPTTTTTKAPKKKETLPAAGANPGLGLISLALGSAGAVLIRFGRRRTRVG